MSRRTDAKSSAQGGTVLAVALAVVLALVVLPASAAELWVAPADKSDHEVGNWGVTNNGEAHFTFAVPDDLVELTSAEVVLLGKRDRSVSCDVGLSISQDGLAQDAITASADGLPVTLVEGQITALDVTSLLPPALDAGDDLVAVSFQAKPNGQAHVVGLRLRYSTPDPLAGAGCAEGEVLRGFDDDGEAVCVDEGDSLAVLDCPDGEVFVSWDEAAGEAVCITREELLAGLTCPPDSLLTGFGADGAPECLAIADLVLDGGGGGGGGGGGEGGTGQPTLTIDNVTVIEGDGGQVTTAVFTVFLLPAATATATVDYATADDTATAGSDYTATSGTLTYLPGQTSQTISVNVLGDDVVEALEEFRVVLSNANGAVIGIPFGEGRITDDDQNVGR